MDPSEEASVHEPVSSVPGTPRSDHSGTGFPQSDISTMGLMIANLSRGLLDFNEIAIQIIESQRALQRAVDGLHTPGQLPSLAQRSAVSYVTPVQPEPTVPVAAQLDK